MKPIVITTILAVAAAAHAEPAPADDTSAGDDRLTPDQQRAYREQMLTFGERPDLIVSHGSGMLTWEYATYEGKYGHEISIGAFLRKTGRPDLAARYEHREYLRSGLVLAGLAAFLAGPIYFYDKHCEVASPACSAQDGAAMSRAAIFSGVGAALIVGGIVTPRDRPSPEEMGRLADDYDDRLRAQLRGARVNVTPYAAPGGGGAMVSGSF